MSLERVQIGHTDVAVTRLGLGLGPIGGLYRDVTQADAIATIDRAWELGIRFFDTAPFYGLGTSECRTGSALNRRPRGEFTLSTKVGRLIRPTGISAATANGGAAMDAAASIAGSGNASRGPSGAISDAAQSQGRAFRDDGQAVPSQSGWQNAPDGVEAQFDFSYAGIMASVTESIERLGIEAVDVLHLHDPDNHFEQALSDGYRALAELREKGVVKAIGVGMNQAEMLTRFARAGDFDCLLIAGRITLLDQSGLEEFLPVCRERGISVIAAGVFQSGLLADPRPDITDNYATVSPERLAKALEIKAVCESFGVPLRAAAIQYPLRHNGVASVLVGARSPAEVDDAVAMYRYPIPEELWEAL